MITPILEAFPLPTNYVDLRAQAAQATGGVYLKSAKYPNGVKLVKRSIASITGFTLHQSAMDRGEDEQGYIHGGAHWFVTRGGKALHVVDAEWNGPFANGFNARTISIEMVGLYAGIVGNVRTLWDNPATPKHEVEQELTSEAIATAFEIMRYEHTRLVKLGAVITKCLAHRQASGSRQSDPGEAVWRSIALPISAELDYDDGGAGFAIDDGRVIPEQWDPARKGKRY